MKRTAFTLLGNMEKTWWYRGRSAAVRTALSSLPRAPKTILDFGAGFGGMYDVLSKGEVDVYGFEPDEEARTAAVHRGYAGTYANETEAFSRTYDAICLFDVLEHLEDDAGFLERAKKALAPGGVMLITVPALPFLWSVHDVEHHHFRRYTSGSLQKLFRNAGYQPTFVSYWNMLLFFPAAFIRLLGKTGESGLTLPFPLEQIFYGIVRSEAAGMKYIRLPFGTGLVFVAKANSAS